MERVLSLIYPSIKSWNNTGAISLPWNCKYYKIPHPSLRVASNSNQTKTNHHWLNHLQTLHTLYYATSLMVGLSGSSQTPAVTKGTLALTSLSHFTWLTPGTKRYQLRFAQPPCFVQLHQEPKEELFCQVDRANKPILILYVINR